ncbi:condensin complex subunit 2 isoform X2 [Periplaneta americana]
MEMRQRDSTPPTSEKRKSIGGSISGLSPAQLADHYANCIKLSAENKINTKNAFSLQLIDYMAMMLKKRDSKMDNFQVASCTLDASTKIYAYRVDCVHTDVLKMAGGLAAGYRKKQNEAGGEEPEDGQDGDEEESSEQPVRTKKKTRRRKNTIATNVETLNGKLDVHCMRDPYFLRSAGGMGECQPGDCHFLASCKVLNNSALILSSEQPYWNNCVKSVNTDQLKVQLSIPDLKDKEICPVFSQFSFLSWSLDSEKENISPNNILPVLPPEDSDFAFDVNAVPEPLPPEDNDIPPDNFEVSAVDDGFDSEGEDISAPPIACRPNQRGPAANIVDMRKHLSTAPSEYSYFKAGALDLWAGPSHWKIRPTKHSDKFGSTGTSGATTNTAGDGSEMVACRKQKQRQKKELLVELDKNDISFIVEKNTSILKLTKRTMQKVWSADKNTHPPDMHYDIKRFAQLELTKYRVIGVHSIPYEDDQSADYNYENDHDTSEYCPNVANDDLDDGDDGPVDDMLPSQQDVHNSFVLEGSGHLDAFQGDNLVAPPNKVARTFIPYAMRAKKIDMKKLKSCIWSTLTNADNRNDIESAAENLQVEVPVNFSTLYTSLPQRLSPKMAENLTAPLAIVALLHLANEKNLHIEGNEELSDLTISQG